jgi:hypothetical protein
MIATISQLHRDVDATQGLHPLGADDVRLLEAAGLDDQIGGHVVSFQPCCNAVPGSGHLRFVYLGRRCADAGHAHGPLGLVLPAARPLTYLAGPATRKRNRVATATTVISVMTRLRSLVRYVLLAGGIPASSLAQP